MIQEQIHKKILHNFDNIKSWFQEQKQGLNFPLYSSFDLRDSGFKVVPVDANIFPAGFNNICQTDKEHSVELLGAFLSSHYEKNQNILLITEEHTNNPYYWENVYTIYEMIQATGRKVITAIPDESLKTPMDVESVNGHKLKVYPATKTSQTIEVDGFTPDLIISNNDFSNSYQSWVEGLETPMTPPHKLGWHVRRKESFFEQYNHVSKQFCELIDINPFHFNIPTEVHQSFDVTSKDSLQTLAEHTDKFINHLKSEYEKHDIKAEPFAFIKNNAGTYGMGVLTAKSGQDVLDWNNRARTKMKAAKGGRGVSEVILQEGIPSILKAEDTTAEPAIYMLGCELAGGFLRTHHKKGPQENLNSPGAVFKRLCVADLEINVEGLPMENVYGWVAKLGFLAIAKEAQAAKVEFKGYRPGENGPC
ncbi:MAG: glutamate--cysteine ligase [Bdellovibrionales bacterium]|nr:glutamate--cysteine ligase [Bdellovibrionales bacterium]